MADFKKHRLEVIKIKEDFSEAVDDGDSVSSIQDVSITKRGAGKWVDVSSEFGSPSGTQDSDTVQITLGAASADEQAGGNYQLRVEVDTTNGETLVSTPSLKVEDAADPAAP